MKRDRLKVSGNFDPRPAGRSLSKDRCGFSIAGDDGAGDVSGGGNDDAAGLRFEEGFADFGA